MRSTLFLRTTLVESDQTPATSGRRRLVGQSNWLILLTTTMELISPLHTKGLLTISLLTMAKTVLFADAVASWNERTQEHSYFESPPSGTRTTRTRLVPATSFGKSSVSPRNRVIAAAAVRSQSQIERRSRRSTFGPFLLAEAAARSRKSGTCPADTTLQADGVCRMARGGSAAADAGGAVLVRGIPLNMWKVLFQTILTAINVLCWLIPLRSKKISDNKLALSLANAFSGGVFLSLAFGHLIPECVEKFEATSGNLNLPHTTPYLLCLLGYLVIFFVEKVAFDPHEILHEMEAAAAKTVPSTPRANGNASPASAVSAMSESPSVTPPPFTGSRSAVILLGALAVHSILEMMALGLSDSFGDCALLTLSIALHQPAESIALLVAFLKSGMPKDDILRYLSVFSCMGPIGVGLGMAVNQFAAPIVDSVMLAIVAGTFVYVGATEVIPEEWEDPEHKWKKFAALMSGIISILVITNYTMGLT
jgi:solute carrier family 39 (zinc transporter), member 1/2/3